jgi:hypothetical protein
MPAPSIHAGRLIDRLEAAPAAVRALVSMLTPDEARWKPNADAWSVLEIVCHLADEEAEDFRARLRSTLEDPARDWTPIDPAGWATQRNYAEKDLAERLDRFTSERADSVAWLRSLDTPDWSAARVHPEFGSMRAGDLLAAWAAHDALHLRQIAKRLHQLAGHDAGPFETGYAGCW